MLVLICGSVGVKLKTQLFKLSYISRPKKPCRISCYFLDLIFLAWIEFCYFSYLGMVNPILLWNLRESPLEVVLTWLWTVQQYMTITRFLSLQFTRKPLIWISDFWFHVSNLCKSFGFFNLFGNEIIHAFTETLCTTVYNTL